MCASVAVKALIARELNGASKSRLLCPPQTFSRVTQVQKALGHLSAVYCIVFDRTGDHVITVHLTSSTSRLCHVSKWSGWRMLVLTCRAQTIVSSRFGTATRVVCSRHCEVTQAKCPILPSASTTDSSRLAAAIEPFEFGAWKRRRRLQCCLHTRAWSRLSRWVCQSAHARIFIKYLEYVLFPLT